MTRYLFYCLVCCLGFVHLALGARLVPVDRKLAPDVFVWTDTCNVYVLRDGDTALLIDLGDGSVLEHLAELGIKRVEWVLFTHYYREQCQGVPRLQGTGAQLAAPEAERDLFEKPASFRKMNVSLGDKFTIHGSSYVRPPIQGIPLDRRFKTNDTFTWRGREFICMDTRGNSPGGMTYLLKQGDRLLAFSGDLVLDGARMHTSEFTVDWMPGQTEFALCLHGKIDGRKVAFTGDNIFGDPDDPRQTGHEAMVAHNSAILEEGYIYGAEFLKRLKPDLLMGGHSFVMDRPAAFIERYRKWSYQMRDAFRALSSEGDYRYWFDPFWVRAEPYRISVKAGAMTEIQLHVRNFNSRTQKHRIEIHAPEGLVAETAVLEGSLAKASRAAFPVRLRATDKAEPGVRIVAFDVTLDGKRYGERFDCVVNVE